MINSAIDSIIRNDEIFFTNTQSKQGRKIYFNLTWDPNYTQEQKEKKKKNPAELESRNATQGVSKEHVIVNIFLNVSNKVSWATLSLKKNLL